MEYNTKEEYEEALGKTGRDLCQKIIEYTPANRASTWNDGCSLCNSINSFVPAFRALIMEYLREYCDINTSEDRYGQEYPNKLLVFNSQYNVTERLFDAITPYIGDGWYTTDINSSPGGDEVGYYIDYEEQEDEDDEDDEEYGSYHTSAGSLKSYSTKAERNISAGREIISIIANEEVPNLYIGLELECLAQVEYVADRIHDTYGDYVICKEDGSLPDNGLEIVTIPQTPEFHKVNMSRLLEEYKEELRSYASRSTGLHIHLNKRFFTNSQMGKIILFVNHEDNYEFMQTIAQRDFKNNSYCTKVKVNKFSDCMEGIGKTRRVKNFDRTSVNVQPQHTIELRFFKGNTLTSSLMAKIDFVEALSYFVKSKSTRSMTVPKFIKYLDENPSKYLNLKEYLTKRLHIEFSKEVTLEEQAA